MPRRLLVQSEGQASVEAAFLLPTLLVTLGLLLQPACILYTRMVMRQAAAETARLLVTTPGGADTARAFCIRRLRAIPDAALFHTGGDDGWTIGIAGDGADAEVSITGHVRPLPLFGTLAGIVLAHDGEGILVSVTHSARLRPAWLGGGEDDWSNIWKG